MEKDKIEYYNMFEQKLEENLVRMCSGLGMLDGKILTTEDLDMKWKEIAPEYMADAVKEINSFPEAAIGWAGYIGMAVAKFWDEDWGKHHSVTYKDFYGKRGFDDMDDNIMENILGYSLASTEAGMITRMLMACCQSAIGAIRHENIEPSSIDAFHILARATKVLYRIGLAMELKRLGYKIQKLDLNSMVSNKKYNN